MKTKRWIAKQYDKKKTMRTSDMFFDKHKQDEKQDENDIKLKFYTNDKGEKCFVEDIDKEQQPQQPYKTGKRKVFGK